MKKALLLMMFVNLFIFCACDKMDKKNFVGEYTYSTSGKLYFTIAAGNVKSLDISNQKGQMSIADSGEKNKVIVVKTALNGEITTCYATIDGKTITFENTDIDKKYSGSLINGEANINVSATGTIYDHMILIKEEYSGYFTGNVGDSIVSNGLIYSDNIQTVAKRNL